MIPDEDSNDEPKRRKVGRPANPNRAMQQKNRRFYPLEKSADTVRLMNAAHYTYVRIHGKDSTDAEVLRDALRQYTQP